jgi:CMP-N,N'-diacetyllegionaminic acid synthase
MSYIMAIIPARAGSKGVPDKNIRSLDGRPLIAYSIQAGLLAENIDRVVVSTDSEDYAAVAKECGAEVPFLRPAKFATDFSNDYEFVKHALDWLKGSEGEVPEFIVHLRPSTPLREPVVVAAAVEKFCKDKQATALRSVHEMSETAYKVLCIESDRLMTLVPGSSDLEEVNKARQAFPNTYHGNGYVDVLRSEFILKHGKIHGDRVMAYVTDVTHEVDTETDFDYLTYQITRNQALVDRLFQT